MFTISYPLIYEMHVLVDLVICIPPAPGLAFTPIISSTIRSTDEGVEGAEELWSFAEPDFTNTFFTVS